MGSNMIPDTKFFDPDLLDKVHADIGADLLEVFARFDLIITGGYLTRLVCGLSTAGVDIDVLCHVDGHAALREKLHAAGYVLSTTAPSRLHDEPRDALVWFRQKWDHPTRITFDCVVLHTSDYFSGSPDTLADAAVAFIDTYDCHVSRRVLQFAANTNDTPVRYHATPRAIVAEQDHVPDWVDGASRHDERKLRWDRLLPGLPPEREVPA